MDDEITTEEDVDAIDVIDEDSEVVDIDVDEDSYFVPIDEDETEIEDESLLGRNTDGKMTYDGEVLPAGV
jgi:hypothetical protein